MKDDEPAGFIPRPSSFILPTEVLMAAQIALKRVYETPSPDDGLRILVERLWPWGLTKEEAKVSIWLKDIAPSAELRKWFGHDPNRWRRFRERYAAELQNKTELLRDLKQKAKQGRVTLVYAARDKEHNGALVLAQSLAGKKARDHALARR
jgi:uncharacterized protein YeaO (DUF488 family)